MGGMNVLRTESEGQQPLRAGGRDLRGRRQEGSLDCIEKCGFHTTEAMAPLAGAVQ